MAREVGRRFVVSSQPLISSPALNLVELLLDVCVQGTLYRYFTPRN